MQEDINVRFAVLESKVENKIQALAEADARLQQSMRESIANLVASQDRLASEVKELRRDLSGDIKEMKVQMSDWMFKLAVTTGVFGVIAAAVAFFRNFSGIFK